jgi:AcrR family transcriptional regulator
MASLQKKSPGEKVSGRPRSDVSRASILDTAYTFLQNEPVSSISPLHIAQKAGVSTATVYRWWPTKEALLFDAFLNRQAKERPVSFEGSPLERLRHHFVQSGRFMMSKDGIVVARLLAAIQDDSALREEFLERVHSPGNKEMRAAVKDAIREGQLPPKTNINDFLDMIAGPLITRLLIRHEPIRESFVISVFDHVVASTRILATQSK